MKQENNVLEKVEEKKLESTMPTDTADTIDTTDTTQITEIADTNITIPKKGLSTFTIFLILVISFLAILTFSFLIFSLFNSKNINIFSGVYIKNVDVSSLSKTNALQMVNEYIQSKLPEEIILKHDDYETSINISDLNINFDVQDAVNVAYNIGRDSNFFSNNFTILGTLFSNKNIEPTLTIDEESLREILDDISSKLPDKMIESSYYIDGTNLIITKGQTGNCIDIEEMVEYIKTEIKNLNIENNKLEIIVKEQDPSEINLEDIYNEIYKEPVDAYYTQDPYAVFASENGLDFDISMEEAQELLDNSDTECTIPLKVLYPSVTTNMIGTEAFPDLLSSFSTNYATSNKNRTTNLILAANKINGTVLMPGETFSYNQVVGERTIAAGYKEAAIYVNGQVEDGLGGGICQITSTLYNAVVYANLEIVERSNHQFVPSYVSAGRDATVVYGAIDFKFKNTRDYPIKIVCSVASGVASFQIYGLKTDNEYDVEIYSTITSQTSTSINSETYKILKQNGVVVEQTLLSRDTYKRN